MQIVLCTPQPHYMVTIKNLAPQFRYAGSFAKLVEQLRALTRLR